MSRALAPRSGSSQSLPPSGDTRRAQSSGVKVSPECLSTFQELKLGKKVRYIIYGLSADYTEIVVTKSSTDNSYDDFLKQLDPNACCWAVYDFEFKHAEGGTRNKICFIAW